MYEAQFDGDDLVFTDYDGNKLDHEIELFDHASGDLAAWVRVPLLVDSADTIFGTCITGIRLVAIRRMLQVFGVQGIAVFWHLHDDFLDSTSYDNDGPIMVLLMLPGVGLADGQHFDGNDYITAPDHCLGASNNLDGKYLVQIR